MNQAVTLSTDQTRLLNRLAALNSQRFVIGKDEPKLRRFIHDVQLKKEPIRSHWIEGDTVPTPDQILVPFASGMAIASNK